MGTLPVNAQRAAAEAVDGASETAAVAGAGVSPVGRRVTWRATVPKLRAAADAGEQTPVPATTAAAAGTSPGTVRLRDRNARQVVAAVTAITAASPATSPASAQRNVHPAAQTTGRATNATR